MARERNEKLAALLEEARWSRAQAAAAYNRVAEETLNGEIRENSQDRALPREHVGGRHPADRNRTRYLVPGAVPSLEA